MKKININDHIYIKINDVGINHLRKTLGEKYFTNSIENRKVEINNEIWYRLQMHEVFDYFNGTDSMFETTIMIDDSSSIKEAFKEGYQQRVIDQLTSALNSKPLGSHYNEDELNDLSDKYVDKIKNKI